MYGGTHRHRDADATGDDRRGSEPAGRSRERTTELRRPRRSPDGSREPLGRGAGHGCDGATRRDDAVRAAVEQGLVGPATPIIGLLDITGIRASAAALRAAFDAVTAPGTPVLHAFAVKATPLVPVLRLLHREGIGAEVASPGELALARAAGVPPTRTVLDSPAKTPAELREALALGIAVNADNPQELARLDALVRSASTRSPIGIRVNPQVGGGSIDALSTATATSKFGVALRDEGAREWVVRAYLDRPWLTRLHAHSGSQGMPLELMARGRGGDVRARGGDQRAGRAAADRHTRHRRRTAGELRVGRPQPDLRGVRAAAGGDRAGAVRRAVRAGHGVRAVAARQARGGAGAGRVREVGRRAGDRGDARGSAGGGPHGVRAGVLAAAGGRVRHEGAAQGGARAWCRTWRVPRASRATCWRRGGRCRCSNRATTRPRWTRARTTSRTTTRTTRLARPGIHGFGPDGAGGVRFAVVRTEQSLDEIVAESGGAYAGALTGMF